MLVAFMVELATENNLFYSPQAIQDFFDPSHLAAMRAFSEDLLRGKINASKHRSDTYSERGA